jgi:Cu+-exporting ATPase
VDKTGTLTDGKPAVVAVVPAKGIAEEDLLRLAAALEANSEHPLAQAIIRGARERGLTVEPVDAFSSVTGEGVRGTLAGRAVALGNPAMMSRVGVTSQDLAAEEADRLRDTGATVVFVAREETLMGLIAVADPIKATTPQALASLRAEGLRILMVTGDNRRTAEAIARRLGIDEIEAGVLPTHKHEIVTRLKAQGRSVAMAGDGVNDAPALAAADVGIAMGTGTEVAMESAGVTLVKGDLVGIVRARRLSRRTLRNIRQNLFFAFIYNALGVPVAAGILYPWLGVLVSPMIAAAAMSLSSVSVIANALRLRGLTLER